MDDGLEAHSMYVALSLLSHDLIPWSDMICASSTWESEQVVQKDENRTLKWQLSEKISEQGAKTVKIGFLSVSMCTQVSVYVRRDTTIVYKLDYASV